METAVTLEEAGRDKDLEGDGGGNTTGVNADDMGNISVAAVSGPDVAASASAAACAAR